MLGPSKQPSNLRRVEAPDDYWAQVLGAALDDDQLTFDDYRKVEHPYVEQWWEHHWDLAERVLDDPGYDHIRVQVFDAEDLAYRYVVTAIETASRTVTLVEFRLLD